MPTEYLISWQTDGYRLDLYDTNTKDETGKSRLAYQFFHKGTKVFEGADFCASPLHAVDGPETVAGLLSFLSLRPGDTDSEYFEAYTPEQMTFAVMHGEDLSWYGMDSDECIAEIRPGMVDLSETLTVALYLRNAEAMS